MCRRSLCHCRAFRNHRRVGAFPGALPAGDLAGVLRSVPAVFLSGILALLPLVAQGHPHSWIDLQVTVLTNTANEITGLEQEWLFDPYYSQIVLEDIGAEVAADTEDEWLQAIAGRMLNNLSDYQYFTTIEQGDEPLRDLQTGNYQLSAQHDRLRFSFELLLSQPRALSAAPLSYAIADPTYYIEMLHQEGSEAIRIDSASLNCAITVKAPNPPLALIARAAALAIDETGDPDLGRHFAEWVHIQCD